MVASFKCSLHLRHGKGCSPHLQSSFVQLSLLIFPPLDIKTDIVLPFFNVADLTGCHDLCSCLYHFSSVPTFRCFLNGSLCKLATFFFGKKLPFVHWLSVIIVWCYKCSYFVCVWSICFFEISGEVKITSLL